jgi:hypothetical protein
MNIQFFHARFARFRKDGEIELSARGGETIAMEEIPVDMFKELQLGDQLEAKIGKAACSVKDNYNKSIGRKIAVGRMKDEIFDVAAIYEQGEEKEVVLLKDGCQYVLKLLAGAKRVYFMDYQ